MRTSLIRATAAAGMGVGLLVGTAAHAAGPPDHAGPGSGPGARAASGGFTAVVDFSSLQERDVRGNKCEFTLDGELTFTGTLDGVADGTTTAIIFAPCSEATTVPPGTYFDVFRFEGDFTGTVLGEPASGELSYAGVTRIGGQIDALIQLHGDDALAVLRADAEVIVGGSYDGVAKAH